MSAVLEFVGAYRKLGCPRTWRSNTFTFECFEFDEVVSESITLLRDSKAGRMVEFVIDGYDFSLGKFTPATKWTSLNFTFTLDASGEVPVFKDLEDLMNRSKSFVRVPLPPHFYLVDDDILSSEEPIDERVKALQGICKLMMYLAELAHYHDGKEVSDDYKLVFVTDEANKEQKAITLNPYLDKELLSCEIGLDLLNSLQEHNVDSNPNLVKERSIFRSTLIEFLSGYSEGKERFRILVVNWAGFRALYENNLSVYLSGFSFHKAKQEVAVAQLTVADQMSKVVSDISGKILSVPISLVAVIALIKADGVLEQSILVLGITLTSALLAETLAAQKLQYERVRHSRIMMFSVHEKNILQYPKDLRVFLKEVIDGLSANESKLKKSLRTLRVISWLPAVVAITLHSLMYKVELFSAFANVAKLLILVCNYRSC
ncbi:hypothetical protein J1G18_17880 [Pseudomonas sp. MIS38]|uniref:hypothetical protein n=1 Tax=Pseudomonas sp. MIS38 TaxID=91465 RepID=UPI001CA7531E|nr:hypothetical protein [Pseudomonas sp. MIS38]MBY8959161.1 hypothetical protein [Pseudomonas sp. MIS38]